jgi:hypothetical protein
MTGLLFGKKIPDVAQMHRKPEIQPTSVTDDFGRKTMMFIEFMDKGSAMCRKYADKI